MNNIPAGFSIHFFCIGAQKAGTTTLREALSAHPDIYLPLREAHFTDVNENFERGLSWLYQKHYSTYNNQKVVGNINPSLQVSTRSIDRILQQFGNQTKFIFILRNPVERAYSHYLMSRKRGFETLSFTEALRAESFRIQNPREHQGYYSSEPGHFEKNHFGYVSRSKYSNTIEYLYRVSNTEKVRIYLFDDFITRQEEVLNHICEFIGVHPISDWPKMVHSNVAQKPRSEKLAQWMRGSSGVKEILKKIIPNPEIRKSIRQWISELNYKPLDANEKRIPNHIYNEVLSKYFLEDIAQTEKLTGFDLSSWKAHRN